MPTYQITSTIKFSASQKETLAKKITEIHCSTTGAPPVAAQIIFHHLEGENHYHGGIRVSSLEKPLVWIHAICKSGRSQEVKSTIIKNVLSAVAQEGGLDQRQILVYMQEIEVGNTLQYFDGETLELKNLECLS